VLSQTVEYAIRAFLYIARQSPRSVRVGEIAGATKAPRRYLAKVLSQLASEGFLVSMRGPTGGYRLVPGRERASLADITSVFERGDPRRCLLGSGVCGRVPGCPVHARWAPVAESMDEFFAHTTVSSLLQSSPST
jgi:Rrf2 family protein